MITKMSNQIGNVDEGLLLFYVKNECWYIPGPLSHTEKKFILENKNTFVKWKLEQKNKERIMKYNKLNGVKGNKTLSIEYTFNVNILNQHQKMIDSTLDNFKKAIMLCSYDDNEYCPDCQNKPCEWSLYMQHVYKYVDDLSDIPTSLETLHEQQTYNNYHRTNIYMLCKSIHNPVGCCTKGQLYSLYPDPHDKYNCPLCD